MESWKPTPIIKVYEALGTLGDRRIKLDGDTATVKASTSDKTYDVRYDPEHHAIMANDNASYWQGYLGYPGVAFLLAHGEIATDDQASAMLAGFAWKDINAKFKNDWDKTEALARDEIAKRGGDLVHLERVLARISSELEALHLVKLGPRQRPPK